MRSLAPDPYVYTGDIPIRKRDMKTKQPLGGAVFALCLDEYGKEPFMRDNAPYELTSKADGTVVFHGVRDGFYYAVETQAAPGHELLFRPICLEVRDGRVLGASELRVDNARQEILRAGGGGGRQILLAAAGLFLLAAFCLSLSVKKRR